MPETFAPVIESTTGPPSLTSPLWPQTLTTPTALTTHARQHFLRSDAALHMSAWLLLLLLLLFCMKLLQLAWFTDNLQTFHFHNTAPGGVPTLSASQFQFLPPPPPPPTLIHPPQPAPGASNTAKFDSFERESDCHSVGRGGPSE